VADRELPGASVVVAGLEDVRDAVKGKPQPRARGPVR
jgi:hypothetical protein